MAGKLPVRVVLFRSDGSRAPIEAGALSGVVWNPRFRLLPGVHYEARGGVLQVKLLYDPSGEEWLRFDGTRTRDPLHGVVWGDAAATAARLVTPTSPESTRYDPCFSRSLDGSSADAPLNDGCFLVAATIWRPGEARKQDSAVPGRRTRAKKAAAKKPPVENTPAKQAPGKKPAAKKASGKPTPVKKAAGKPTPVKKAAGKPTPAKTASAKKTLAKKAPAKKAPAKKAPAKKPPAKKASAD